MAQHNEIERGGCLSWFLGFVIIVSFLTAIIYIIIAPRFGRDIPLPPSAAYIMSIAFLFQSFFALATWNWRKFGFVGYCIVMIAITGYSFYLELGYISLTGLIGPATLSILIARVWKYFR